MQGAIFCLLPLRFSVVFATIYLFLSVRFLRTSKLSLTYTLAILFSFLTDFTNVKRRCRNCTAFFTETPPAGRTIGRCRPNRWRGNYFELSFTGSTPLTFELYHFLPCDVRLVGGSLFRQQRHPVDIENAV